MSSQEKNKAVDDAISSINKKYGDGTIISLGAKVGKPMPHISTGIYKIDHDLLGIGGLPRGRIVEIFGPESSGKTTLALSIIAAAQKAGGRAAIVDAEHALNPDWMSTLGVDVQNLLVSQPDCGEQGLDITGELIDSHAFDVILVDSVAALVPRAEVEGEIGDAHMGLQARMMSQAMRKFYSTVAKANCVVIFINQIRSKIGVMFGSPETTTGGNALKFASSVRIDVRRKGAIKDGEDNIGNVVKLKTVKNKVYKPFVETEVELLFDSGFDKLGSLFDAAVERDIIQKSGAWYSYMGDRLGQGKSNCITAIKEKNLEQTLLKGLSS